MKKKEKVSDPVHLKRDMCDGPAPLGNKLLDLELRIEIFEDGAIRFGDRIVWKHETVTPGVANLLVMSAMAVTKDATIHKRWATIDKAYAEELEARVKAGRAALSRKKK
jgi:hypothetical protein